MRQCRSGLAAAAMAAGSVTYLASPAYAQTADRDCSDFTSQAAAQSFFESRGPGDPDRLDSDNDGIACENLPGPSAPAKAQPRQPATAQSPQRQQPVNGQGSAPRTAAVTPKGGVAAGGGGMADPSSPALPAAGALLGTLLLGVGVAAARRRATVH